MRDREALPSAAADQRPTPRPGAAAAPTTAPFRAQERVWRSTWDGTSTDPLPAARPAPAGATFGVEEEFHLVDPVSYRLTRSPALAAAVLRATRPAATCTRRSPRRSWRRSPASAPASPELRAELVTTRAEAAGAAARAGVRILAASTHPFDSWQQQDITPGPAVRGDGRPVGRAGAAAGHLRLPRARRRARPGHRRRGDGPGAALPAGAAGDDRQLAVPRRHRHRPPQLPHDVVVALADDRTAGVLRQRRAVPARWSPGW